MKFIKKRTTMLLLGLFALILTPYSTVYAESNASTQVESTSDIQIDTSPNAVDYLKMSTKLDAIDHGELDQYIRHLLTLTKPTKTEEDTLLIAVEVSLRNVDEGEHHYTPEDLDELSNQIDKSAYSSDIKKQSTFAIAEAKSEFETMEKVIKLVKSKTDKGPSIENLLDILPGLVVIAVLTIIAGFVAQSNR